MTSTSSTAPGRKSRLTSTVVLAGGSLRLRAEDESVRRIFAATVAGRARPPSVTRFFTYLDEAGRGFDQDR